MPRHEEYSNILIDAFLDAILPCDTEEEYQRVLVKTKFNEDPASSITFGDRWLRRRAMRRSEYTGPGMARARREGMPYSYTELRILNWAKDWRSEGKVEPDTAYLARMLQRTADEIGAQIEVMKNTAHGIQGFDLDL